MNTSTPSSSLSKRSTSSARATAMPTPKTRATDFQSNPNSQDRVNTATTAVTPMTATNANAAATVTRRPPGRSAPSASAIVDVDDQISHGDHRVSGVPPDGGSRGHPRLLRSSLALQALSDRLRRVARRGDASGGYRRALVAGEARGAATCRRCSTSNERQEGHRPLGGFRTPRWAISGTA